MRLLPTSVQSFKTLRENGYLYVDKTKYIWDLVESGGREYFLSRPRRFGKSLFLSTIEEYFLGRKDFKDAEMIISLASYFLYYLL